MRFNIKSRWARPDNRVTRTLLVALFALLFYGHGYAQSNTEEEAMAFFDQGQNAHEKGDLNKAVELYSKALKILPEFPEAELQLGNALVSLNRLDEAELAFRRAVKLRDDWSLAYANLGALLVRINKLPEARTVLEKGIALDPDNTSAYVAMTTLALRTKATPEELRTLYRKIVSMSAAARPTASVWASRAALENTLGEKKAAAASAVRALELDPKNASMIALAATISLDEKDNSKAESFIKHLESVDSKAFELPPLKIRLLVAEGKAAEALKLIGLMNDPSAEILALKQSILAATSTDTSTLEDQLKSEPRNAVVLGRLCTLLRTSDPAKAMEYCRRAAEAEPNNFDHAIGYGAAMLQTKRYAEAATLFQRLIAVQPENSTIRANFAAALFQLKRYNDAKVQFIWLLEKQPSMAAAYFFLAVSHDELGELADAMANYQLFLRYADPKVNQLEIDKVNLRLPTLQKQLDAGKGRKNAKTKGN